MKILAITSIRSEYDLMSVVYAEINRDPEMDLRLLVGGCHNSPTFGLTVDDIKRDGFNILCQIDSLIDSDASSSRLKSAAILLISSIDIVRTFAPDLIIYAGDREDVMIGALLGGYLGIPTAHFFGGDHASDGHIDNPVRHATSKLSTCHFVSLDEHANRLLKLGEPGKRIFNIGSVALDKFRNIEPDLNIANEISGAAIEKPVALFIFHPVEEEIPYLSRIVSDTVELLIDAGYHVFIGLPNVDHGNVSIRNSISQFYKNNSVTIYGNLPRDKFVKLFKLSKLIVGNSSAGLLESASIPIPCVNIGLRQRGRLCAKNVIFSDSDRESIRSSIETCLSPDFMAGLIGLQNPYGDGYASKRAVDIIKTNDFKSMLKKTEDPLNVGK